MFFNNGLIEIKNDLLYSFCWKFLLLQIFIFDREKMSKYTMRNWYKYMLLFYMNILYIHTQ